MASKIDSKVAIKEMMKAGYEPLEAYTNSKYPWKCKHLKCGETITPTYNQIQQGWRGCKYCSGKYVDPDKAFKKMIQAGVVPLEPYPGKDKKWKCICLQCNKIVDSRYPTVRDGGGGCQRCALRKTAIGRRFSENQVREIFKKVNLKPIEKYTNTDAPLKCKCTKCGNFPSPTFTAIRAGGGCRYCSEKLTSPEKAIKLAKKAGLEPLEKFISGQVPWRCRHIKCGRDVSPIFSTILKGSSGCIECNAKKAAKKYRLPEATVNAIMLNANMKPLEPYVNANTKWRCKCLKCKKIITPTLGNVQNGSGCINCSLYGFNLSNVAYFYLMYHLELNSYKVGVGGGNTKIDRIEMHKSFGWELYNRKDFKRGKDAYEVEQELLLWLRTEVELGVYLLDEQMPQGGHTETVDASEIDLPSIWAKVEELSKKRIKK
jgi:hypothetical protein